MTKKDYSNSFRSLEAIWMVLRRYASKRRPLTVKEICEHLAELEEAPSADTVRRIFPEERELMRLLFPGIPAEGGALTAQGAYRSGTELHIVVETPEGTVLSRDEADLEITAAPFKAPSYSTVDKLLKQGFPAGDAGTFPFQLRCVARKVSPSGRVRWIPYEKWQAQLDERTGENGGEARNNQPRRYYLANVLTDAEWRVFSDLVQVYPFISDQQTRKFLSVLDQLSPGLTVRPASRYAFKRGSDQLFQLIEVLDRAVRERRMVRLIYGEYRLECRDRRWVPVLRPRRRNNGEMNFSPYALMWSNGNYYLVGRDRGMMNLRVDRILSAKLLEEPVEIPPDFDLVEYRDRSPVMYPGERTLVRLRCKEAMLSVILDFFGAVPQYKPLEEGEIEVSMSVAPGGVKLFAMQYAGSVEVLEPASLREELAQELAEAANRYRS